MNFYYFLGILITYIYMKSNTYAEELQAPGNQVLLNEMKEIRGDLLKFQELSENTNQKVLKILSDIVNTLQDTNTRIKSIEVGIVGQNRTGDELSLSDMMERSLKLMQRKSETMESKILSMIGEPLRSNKDIIERLKKIDSQTKESSKCSAIGNSSLPQDIKKEIVESVSSEFTTMKRRFTTLLERLGETEKKCVSLTQTVRKANNQCLEKLAKQRNIEELEEEVKRNLTRIERDVNFRMNQTIQQIEDKMKEVPVIHTTITPAIVRVTEAKIEEPVLPVRPTTSRPKVCRRQVYIHKPENCAVLRKSQANCDGTYVIHPKKKKAVIVFCDMTTDGGGWTVIMRRGFYGDIQTNFHQNWKLYKQGFGRVQKEFWWGNENLHLLTSGDETNQQQLLVELESFQKRELYLTFDNFSVQSEADNYRLRVGNVTGNNAELARSFTSLNQQIFRTFDKNEGQENCALRSKSGWWYGDKCDQSAARLTTPFFEEDDFRENWQGIQWPSWKKNAIMKTVQMKIRPMNFLSNNES